MIGTIYLHAERCLVARWNIEDVPVLLGMDILPPIHTSGSSQLVAMDHVRRATDGCRAVRVAVPDAAAVLHWYPYDRSESAEERRDFEFATCMAASVPVLPVERLFQPLAWPRSDVAWELQIAVPDQVDRMIDDLAMAAPVERVVLALDAERAALRTMARDADTALLAIGRRDNRWVVLGLGRDGRLGTYEAVPVLEAVDPASQIRDLLLDVQAAVPMTVRHVVLFGDGITRSLIDDARQALEGLVDVVERLQPFRAVRADIDSASRSQCLRLAHVVGPLVGLVLDANFALTIPCASLAAR